MGRKKAINCLFIWLSGIILCDAQVGADDRVFYRTMFSDVSMHGPFIVVDIQFEGENKRLEKPFVVLTRNGVLWPMVREVYHLNDEKEYIGLMLYLKFRDQPIILPISFKERLEQFLLSKDEANCEILHSIRMNDKPDKFVKAYVEVKYPMTDAERNCLIFDLYEKRELVNAFTESGKLYITY